MMKRSLFCLILICMTYSISWAQNPLLDTYTQALKIAREDKPEVAVEMLWTIVNDHPEDSLADDALYQIGSLNEQMIGNYDAAKKAYLKLLKEKPRSRNARRARTRLKRLDKDRESGDEPLRKFRYILQNYPRLGGEKSLQMMKKLYVDYPTFGQRDHAVFWIAEELRRMSKHEEADEYYEILFKSYPKSKWMYYGVVNRGLNYLERRMFDEAIESFKGLAEFEGSNPGSLETVKRYVEMANRFKNLRRMYFYSIGIVVIAFLFWLIQIKWREIGKKQLLGSLVDIAIVSPAFAGSLFYMIAKSKSAMFISSLALLWGVVSLGAFCNHLYISTNRFSPLKRTLLSLAMLFVAAAMVYAVLYYTDAVNLLYDSLQYDIQKWGIG